MNWEAISAVGEVVSAAAVVFSLIYVGTQIRQNTKTSRDEAIRDIYVATTNQLNILAAPENAECVLKGLDNFRALSREEKYRFDNLLGGLVNLVETSVLSNDVDLIQDETMDAWANFLGPRYFEYPGMAEWWNEARMVYAPSTRAWMDREIKKACAENSSSLSNVTAQSNGG